MNKKNLLGKILMLLVPIIIMGSGQRHFFTGPSTYDASKSDMIQAIKDIMKEYKNEITIPLRKMSIDLQLADQKQFITNTYIPFYNNNLVPFTKKFTHLKDLIDKDKKNRSEQERKDIENILLKLEIKNSSVNVPKAGQIDRTLSSSLFENKILAEHTITEKLGQFTLFILSEILTENKNRNEKILTAQRKFKDDLEFSQKNHCISSLLESFVGKKEENETKQNEIDHYSNDPSNKNFIEKHYKDDFQCLLGIKKEIETKQKEIHDYCNDPAQKDMIEAYYKDEVATIQKNLKKTHEDIEARILNLKKIFDEKIQVIGQKQQQDQKKAEENFQSCKKFFEESLEKIEKIKFNPLANKAEFSIAHNEIVKLKTELHNNFTAKQHIEQFPKLDVYLKNKENNGTIQDVDKNFDEYYIITINKNSINMYKDLQEKWLLLTGKMAQKEEESSQLHNQFTIKEDIENDKQDKKASILKVAFGLVSLSAIVVAGKKIFTGKDNQLKSITQKKNKSPNLRKNDGISYKNSNSNRYSTSNYYSIRNKT